ncbi:MAG: undecaprenyl-diphosphatase UppP [Desulfobacterales bacterium]|nr:undecaprenyl-diphosphatase UppP [Desulfobacterales bacterium]
MDLFQAVVLGIIQGLTEFLPISSSGHLIIFQHLFGLTEPALFFDISLHVGTLIAVIVFFRRDIRNILSALQKLIINNSQFSAVHENPDIRITFLIILGSVPTAIIGLFFKNIADRIFSSVTLTGIMLLITGLFLWSTRWIKKTGKDVLKVSVLKAFIIGTVQGLAILPGISRSGSTIVAGLFLGLNRETAAKYSFLLSIPAIIGAEILSLKDLFNDSAVLDLATCLGTVAAGITGYCSLKLLLFIIKKGKLHLFAPYCWLAGVVALTLIR